MTTVGITGPLDESNDAAELDEVSSARKESASLCSTIMHQKNGSLEEKTLGQGENPTASGGRSLLLLSLGSRARVAPRLTILRLHSTPDVPDC